jgi:hypothetical protein
MKTLNRLGAFVLFLITILAFTDCENHVLEATKSNFGTC